jgi:Xaa-Pro dipeptidase
MIKEPHEIALMRSASQVTLKAYEAAYRALKPGMTPGHGGLAHRAGARPARVPGRAAGAQVGTYTALPHGSIQPQKIREGTIIMVDGGCAVEGYSRHHAHVRARQADRKMTAVFTIVKQAQTATLNARSRACRSRRWTRRRAR